MKIFELLKEIKNWLKEENIKDYKVEAEIILSYILNKDRLGLYLDFNQEVLIEDIVEIFDIANRRVEDRIPIQYIFSKADFYGYSFKVNKSVLIPRKETEILVETSLTLCKEFKKTKILDIGTGSGIIAISLNKKTRNSLVTATDISEDALNITLHNSKMNGAKVELIKSDIFSNVNGRYDIIVSNPPYISEEDFEYLEPEIKDHEPKLALVAPREGLYFYEEIAKEAHNFLYYNSYLVLEIGYNIFTNVRNILEKEEYEIIKVVKDYNMQNRVIVAKSKKVDSTQIREERHF